MMYRLRTPHQNSPRRPWRPLLAAVAAALIAPLALPPLTAAAAAPAAATSPVTAGNLDFEQGLTGWTAKGTASAISGTHAAGGTQYVRLSAGASISRTYTDIPQGSYTLGGSFDGASSNNTATLSATETGAPDANALLDVYLKADGSWVQAAHRNVLVYNGQVTVTITAGTSALNVDSLTLTLDSHDANPLQNWGFENGLTGWSINDPGKVSGITTNTDSGAGAVQMAAGGEITQTIPVEANTRYIVSARAKVQTTDSYTSTQQTDRFGNIGTLVTRTSTGDRINIGARSSTGTVLRQAPAASDGYSLVTVSFTTGPNDSQVTLYANTIADQAYRDSVGVHTGENPATPADDWAGNGSDNAWIDNFDVFTLDDTYLRGGDVSNLQVLEDNGGKYFANGVQQDALRILSNRGVNSITSMIFVHAGETLYDNNLQPIKVGEATPQGAYPDTNKIAHPGYFDKTHTVALAERAKALQLSYLPSFHLSDSFMSSAKASTPFEWLKQSYDGTLANSDIAHMRSIVYNYVVDTLSAIKDTDVKLAGVKQGNEENGGMVWPIGQGATSVGHAAIIAAVNDAVQTVTPALAGHTHTNNGYSTADAKTFFKGLINNGAKIDAASFSLYGGRSSANILNMAEMLNADPALRYLDYVNVETAASFTKYKATWVQENVITPEAPYYRTNPNGVYNWLLDYMQAPLDVPSPYGQTRGFYYWEIDWIPVNAIGSKQGVPIDISSRTMFNNGDPSVTQEGSSQVGKSGDMLDSMNAYLMRGVVKNKTAAVQTPLNNPGVHAPYAVTATAPTGISLVTSDVNLPVGERQRLQPVITPTDQVLTDSRISYSSADPAIAAVSEYGFVQALTPGTTTVTASVVGGKSTSATVTVRAPLTATSGDLTVKAGASTLTDGQTLAVKTLESLQLTATLPASVDDQMLDYSSSNPDVAAFFGETWQTPDGALKAYSGTANTVQLNILDAGTTDLTIATADGGTSITIHLTSTKTPVTGLTLDKPTANVSIGGTVALGGRIQPADATKYKITWTSADPAIATVNSAGVVTGVANGQTTVTGVSQDNPAVSATSTVTVSGNKVTSVTLDTTATQMQVGTTRVLRSTVAPADASDRSLDWSSSDTAVATVGPDGTVTARAIGVADITATTRDGSALTATARITVQEEANAVTSLKLETEEYWFRSDYFADDSTVTVAPTKTLALTIAPADATNADIVWTSDTPQVATVGSSGTVTPVSAGIATITASTRDGSVSTSAKVYVPALSESFETRGAAYAWKTTQVSTIPAMTAKVANGNSGKALVFTSKSGTGASALQKTLTSPALSRKVTADFTYNPGTPGSTNGAYLAITDRDGNRYLTLRATNGGELAYGNGGKLDATNAASAVTGLTPVGTGFNVNASWYTVHTVTDFDAKTVTFTITSRAKPSVTATHTIPFAAGTAYTGDVARFQLWTTGAGSGVWYPAIDDVTVYDTEPVAKQVTVNSTSVRLIPVTGTLGVEQQLSAQVLPATASQDLTWTSSNPELVTVSSTGLVSATKTYDSIGQIEPGSADITVAATTDPAVKTTVHVEVTDTPHASEQFSVIDADGATVFPASEALALATGDSRVLIAKPTGGDGATDIANIEWTSSDPSVVALEATPAEEAGITVTALKKGSATITVKVYIYSTDVPLTAQIPITVDGGAPTETTPAAPAAPTIGVSDNKVNVSWVKPSDGGAAITGYTVTATPTTGTAVVKKVPASATSTSFTGLPAGSWTASVTAENAVGSSAASPASAAAKVTTGRPVPLSISAKSQCVNGRAAVAVHALNTGQHNADIRFTVGTMTEKFTAVAAGKGAYKLFDTGATSVAAGTATVIGYSYVDGVGYYATSTTPYAAITCG